MSPSLANILQGLAFVGIFYSCIKMYVFALFYISGWETYETACSITTTASIIVISVIVMLYFHGGFN